MTLKALLMPCVLIALGCDLVVPNPCLLHPGEWGPWWGQQDCVGGLCLEGKTPTTVRGCHQKSFGFKVLNLSEEEIEAQLCSGCVGAVTLRSPGGCGRCGDSCGCPCAGEGAGPG